MRYFAKMIKYGLEIRKVGKIESEVWRFEEWPVSLCLPVRHSQALSKPS